MTYWVECSAKSPKTITTKWPRMLGAWEHVWCSSRCRGLTEVWDGDVGFAGIHILPVDIRNALSISADVAMHSNVFLWWEPAHYHRVCECSSADVGWLARGLRFCRASHITISYQGGLGTLFSHQNCCSPLTDKFLVQKILDLWITLQSMHASIPV